MSTLRASLETIVSRLETPPIDAVAAERSAAELTDIGQAVTAQLEVEYLALTDAAEPNAA